jgi:hypothetical protein
MLVKLDKFFIRALQEAGYEIDYKKARELYSKSRDYPEQKKRSHFNQMINSLMYESEAFECNDLESTEMTKSKKSPKKNKHEKDEERNIPF